MLLKVGFRDKPLQFTFLSEIAVSDPEIKRFARHLELEPPDVQQRCAKNANAADESDPERNATEPLHGHAVTFAEAAPWHGYSL